MSENKKQFYFSDKPIDLADIITSSELEYPKETFSSEPKSITMSFDCEMPKETEKWFKEQMKELDEKEKDILESYAKIAKDNAEYYMPFFSDIMTEESKKELLESIIMHSLCKGWNDCFEINVKHEEKNI